MMVAGYAMLGLKLEKGDFSLRADAFEPRGEIVLRKVVYNGKTYEAPPA